MPPRVSVVIPTLNGKALLAECLEALRAQTFRDFETIVVENGSTDGTVAWLAVEHPDVRCIALAENRGFAGGCNAGIAAAAGELVVLLNNDALAQPGWLAALVLAADAHPEAGSFASQVRMRDRPDTLESLGDFYSVFGWAGHLRLGWPAAEVPPGVSSVFGACACAALYRRSALEDAGVFDEDFFVSHEDVDLAFRLRLRGYGCLCVHDAVVLHRGFSTRRRTDPRTLFLSRRNQIFVLAKNLPTPLLFLLSPFLLCGQVLGFHSRFVRVGWFRAVGATLAGRYAALLDLPSLLRKRCSAQRRRRISSWALLRMFRFLP